MSDNPSNQPRMMGFGVWNDRLDFEWMSDALDSCSMPISLPPMAAMPSHRFIAQWADRMDDIDTSKRKKKKSVEHHYA